MPYNQDLAAKVRNALVQYPDVEEKEKMGGLSFMRNGKVCVRIQDDDLLIRCEPDETEELLTKTGARRYTMRSKTNMKGWLLINPEGTEPQNDFNFWMGITINFNAKSKP